MCLKAALSVAAALIIGPILALGGYKHWLDTRNFHPLDIPVSLSRGHIRTPDFYINLTGKYCATLGFDHPVSNTSGCAEAAWPALQTHTIAYNRGVGIGDSDGPQEKIEVFNADAAIAHAFDQVGTYRGGKFSPSLKLWHLTSVEEAYGESVTEDKAPHLVAQTFHFLRVSRGTELLGQSEKLFLSLFGHSNAFFNEFHQDPVLTQPSTLGNPVNLLCDPRRQAYAPSDRLGIGHDTTIHQFGAIREPRSIGCS